MPDANDGRTSRTVSRAGPRAPGAARSRPQTRGIVRAIPPVLVRQIRNGIVESEHRGHIVEVDPTGRVLRLLGDPEHLVTLRSAVKPFGLLALVEAGGVEAFDLTPAELAIMAGSHSGEDLHVRTIQDVFRRAKVSQLVLACGTEGMPLDALTAARLARDGERPGPLRHMCSGQHASFILLARLKGWPLETYWRDEHPAMSAYRSAVARAFGVSPERLRTAIDGCGLPTFAFPLCEVAHAYAILAEPDAVPATDRRAELAPALRTIRDAMLASPEMVAGRHDRIDTSLMKAVPGRLVSKGGMEALRAVAVLRGPRTGVTAAGPSGLVIKVEDGDGHDRATWAATVESLHQAGVLDGAPLRQLGRYHRPSSLDPHGRLAAEAVAEFELAPVGELVS